MKVVPRRLAVIQQDTGQVLSLVSDRYRLVPHQRILDAPAEPFRARPAGLPGEVRVERSIRRLDHAVEAISNIG